MAPEQLAAVVARVAELGPDEIALADTIGVAAPSDVEERLALVQGIDPACGSGCTSTTRGTRPSPMPSRPCGAASRVLDASLAGIGGCPFAPAATGNVATEDIVYTLGRMGYETGVELEAAIDAARWLAGRLGIEPAGMVARAGAFP